MAEINQLSKLINLQQTGISEFRSLSDSSPDKFLATLREIQAKGLNNTATNTDAVSSSSLQVKPSLIDTQTYVNSMQNKGNFVVNAINDVNAAQLQAEKSVAAFASGYGDELQATLDISKAEKYLQFFSEVRVKLVNAIKELSRTQI